uniref:NADH-ubiquinone oxidoreductase chain 1 n=1 Tax=Siboglinum plumosum TaxID=3080496 RepID=A0AA97AL59_9ANNE|nr:NADH dehydrogenase subunit 1 [Siboglinum plumosum]WNZ34609.1 NADH dehydrogenase subunit 1 [Siboglinum plumosum]
MMLTSLITLTYLMVLLSMAFFTLLERKLLGYLQLRKGPNKISLMGLPLPFADAIKLFCKEYSSMMKANTMLFVTMPIFNLAMALLLWSLYPYSSPSFFFSYGSLLFICLSSTMVYPLMLSGWSSNSKYALIGAIRSIAQTISYEVNMSFILLTLMIIFSSFNLVSMSVTHSSPLMILLPFLFLIWVASILAETNRTPFDLSEGESELVSGFNVEYSSNSFAFIFMAEYTNILAMSLFSTIFFFSSPLPIFHDMVTPMKIILVAIFFIWARGTLPRMRYDLLMSLTWKSLLPITIIALMFSLSMKFFI